MISVNPFKYGGAVTGEYFTDREEEIKTLLLDLKSGQNVILYSPRRFGKTSLIWRVMNHLKEEGFLCIYTDLSPISSKREFAQKLASEIAKGTSSRFDEVVRKLKNYLPKITPKIVLKGEGDMEFDIKFEDREMNIEELLISLYDLPQEIAQKRKKKVIMVFDEFQQIGEIDGDRIEKELRAKIQHHSDVAYVFMGSKHHLMERIFNDKSRPFYKIGKTFTLRKIPLDRFFAFIENRLKETGIEIEPTLIERVLNRTFGHPHYTQMFMHEIWNESYPGRIITQDSIERALEQILLNEWEAFTTLWDSLSSKQKNLLVALVFDEHISLHSQVAIIRYELGSPATVSKSLKVLENKGIFEQEGGRYVFSDIFLKEWIKIRDRYPVEDYTLIEKLVPSKALPQLPFLPVIYNQTPPEPNFVGRVKELSTITNWYQDPTVRIGTLIGWGGVGKSALARKWYDCLSENNIQPDGIFWWGFYRNPLLDAFLNEFLRYVSQGEIEPESIKGNWEKVERIKGYLHQKAYLLILDGLEQMQKQAAGNEFGKMVHREFTELLHYLADTQSKGLCLITTRFPLKDLENWHNQSYRNLELIDMDISDALAMLKKRGIKGDDEAIKDVLTRYKGHALSLTTLAGFLNKYYDGDINQAPDIRFVLGDEKRFKDVNKLLQKYSEKMSEPELVFLKIFSLFRKEITEREFSCVFRYGLGFNDALVKMDEIAFKDLLDGLVEWRLISFDETKKSYTTHPLIKGYFESIFDEKDKRLCHKQIYHYLGTYVPDKPETIDQMQPLFEQVYHGCQADLHQEAFDDVYWQKVHRGEEAFLVWNLGAWETNLSLIQNFFPDGDFEKEPLVSKIETKSYLINEAGLSMRMIGRLKEVEGLYKKAIELAISKGDWGYTSVVYQNLASLQRLIGNLLQAKEYSEEAIQIARKARDVICEYNSTASLAYLLFLLGEIDKAGIEFEKAGALQRKIDPAKKYLYSGRGIYHSEFLLAQGRIQEALEVTNENLRICKEYNWIDDINRCHRSLATIYRYLKDLKGAEENVTIALEGARKTGRQDIEVEALIELARIKLEQSRLKEAESLINHALQICRRCGYRLYEADCYSLHFQIYRKTGRSTEAEEAQAKAQSIVRETGYNSTILIMECRE